MVHFRVTEVYIPEQHAYVADCVDGDVERRGMLSGNDHACGVGRTGL